MSLMEQLKEKIDEIKVNYEIISGKNKEYQVQIGTLINKQKTQDEAMELLKYEIKEKDKELQTLLDKLNTIVKKEES